MSNRAFNVSVDLISASAIIGAFVGALPALAGLAGLIWYALQIWESKTVQKRVRLWKSKARAKRLASIQVEAKHLQARIAHVEATSHKPSA